MCMGKPSMPAPPPPPPPPPALQESKTPDMNAARQAKYGRNNAPIAGGTLLTGQTMGMQGGLNVGGGGKSLLGG